MTKQLLLLAASMLLASIVLAQNAISVHPRVIGTTKPLASYVFDSQADQSPNSTSHLLTGIKNPFRSSGIPAGPSS